MSQRPAILDCAAALADLTRCRLLALLAGHELTVSELCTALQLPQSTVSRHLKVLGDGGWLRSRRDGTSHFYRLLPAELEPSMGRLWQLVAEQLATDPSVQEDSRRLAGVLAARQSRSQQFFSSTAGEWDRLRDELFGRRFDVQALLGLLDPNTVFGDLACGTGRVAEALSPFVARVVAVDGSSAMLDAARGRLAGLGNVEVRAGELEALPLADAELDAAALFLALHHVAEPAGALAEATRVLRPGGRLLLVDMMPHSREEYRSEMGHVWLGFGEAQVRDLMRAAGLDGLRYCPLPADPDAKGPSLFAATARCPAIPAPSRAAERAMAETVS